MYGANTTTESHRPELELHTFIRILRENIDLPACLLQLFTKRTDRTYQHLRNDCECLGMQSAFCYRY
jgi:hypothetical protein